MIRAMRASWRASIVAGLVACGSLAASEVGAEPLTTVRVASGLSRPTFVTHAPGDFTRVFITEQTGRIRILDLQSGTVLPNPFLDLTSTVSCCGERGLLGLAFHPDYATNGFLYVTYSNGAGDSEVARYRVLGDPATSNVADPGSSSALLTIPEPAANHNIGWIAFGPDGYLYIGKGDGGSSCDPNQRAQDLDELHGKILRIDVDGGTPYGIPPDNPFVGGPGADEIWAYGLRNPWRNAFDPATGDLFIADVGQSQREEIDFQPAASGGGENYGWDCMEGTECSTVSGCGTAGCTCGAAGLVLPIHQYDHGSGCSITGGEVYRGNQIDGLSGTYFFADYCSARIWSFRYDGATVSEFQERTGELAPGGGLSIGSISSFGHDAFGELYISDLSGGEVFKIIARCGNGVTDAGEDCDDGEQNGTGRSGCAEDCQNKPDGPADCDGNSCTRPDTCTNGVCSPGACADGGTCSICGGTCQDTGSSCVCE
jgi:glucose/arabinose dehydrogenase